MCFHFARKRMLSCNPAKNHKRTLSLICSDMYKCVNTAHQLQLLGLLSCPLQFLIVFSLVPLIFVSPWHSTGLNLIR